MDNKDDKETLENNIEHGNMHAVKKEIKWIRIIFDEGKKIGLGLYLDNASSMDEIIEAGEKNLMCIIKIMKILLRKMKLLGSRLNMKTKMLYIKKIKKSTLNLCFIFPL